LALTPGTRLGVYEVTAAIGEGGMGQVYRATDTTLGRQVAIKILPDAFASDPERLSRFEREAQTLASLNHPHIAAIYGFEKSGGLHALVMELVEGEDLSQRIAHGAIPLDEALAIAKQIAGALEAAHEQGIIHRDLKPANIKVRNDGTVKVLDFGLAKAVEPAAGSSPSMSMSPTLSMHATQMGVILGTAAYMAPEQARGKTVDKRADIWAFGAVLYEMLTRKRAFPGEDITDTLAAVVRAEPDWSLIPKELSPTLLVYLRRCLQKDAKQRIGDIHDVRLAMDGAFETTAPQTTASATATASHGRLAWVAFAVAVVGMVALAIPALRHLRETPPPATRLAHLTMGLAPAERLGPTTSYARPSRTAFAMAPDGATIVFSGEINVSGGTPTTMLYRRPLAATQAVAIPGTEGAEYPFFSPDGQWVGFGAGNKLKKVALTGGPPIDMCDLAGQIEGASWGPAGVIVFAARGLWTVSDSGGKPNALAEGDPNADVYCPAVLPGGQTVLYTSVPGNAKWEDAHIDAINLITKQRKTLLTNAADGRYSPTGHLVFMRSAALLAVPFDSTRGEVTGAPVPLLAGIMQSTNALNSGQETGMGQFALSASGVLLYASGDRYPTRASTLVRVDRKGAETKLAEIQGTLFGLRLSPSGARVVAFKTGDGSLASDIWLFDLPSGTPTRLTSTGEAYWPLFSLDGKSVMFTASGSNPGIYALWLDGRATPQRIIEGKAGAFTASWSPDGKWLAYLQGVGSARQIFVRPVRDASLDAGEPRQFSPSTFGQRDAEFSPDSRWIAYVSDESRTNEVYVQAFPGPGEKRRISSNTGGNLAWSRNSRELFYIVSKPRTPTISMMAVDFSTTGDFKTSTPRLLFEGPYAVSSPLRSYDVTSDGQFIMTRSQPPPDQPVTTLNVVLGWAEELKARVPAGK
jgi:Tol biopolymer transport system component